MIKRSYVIGLIFDELPRIEKCCSADVSIANNGGDLLILRVEIRPEIQGKPDFTLCEVFDLANISKMPNPEYSISKAVDRIRNKFLWVNRSAK